MGTPQAQRKASSGNVAPVPPPAENAGNGAGVSPSIADQLKEAAIASSAMAAETLSAAMTDPNANPFTDLFGPVTFRLPDREGVYKDEKRPTVTNRRMAFATFVLVDLVEVDASIYAREETKKDDNGAYLESTLSLSLPTANRQAIFKVPKGRPDIQLMIDAWKYQIVDQYETWVKELAAATPVGRADTSMLPRHVRRTPLPLGKM